LDVLLDEHGFKRVITEICPQNWGDALYVRVKPALCFDIGANNGRWTREEHQMFICGLRMYGRDWKKVLSLVPTRTR
jgi:hypothetical protein